jgi:hypothetical protein
VKNCIPPPFHFRRSRRPRVRASPGRSPCGDRAMPRKASISKARSTSYSQGSDLGSFCNHKTSA